jgi:hypothetical protein
MRRDGKIVEVDPSSFLQPRSSILFLSCSHLFVSVHKNVMRYPKYVYKMSFITLERSGKFALRNNLANIWLALRTQHMSALKRIIRYTQSTIDFDLLHLYLSIDKLISYTDANCVYIFWQFDLLVHIKTTYISRSSADVEYHGVANEVSKSGWTTNLHLKLHCPITKAILI